MRLGLILLLNCCSLMFAGLAVAQDAGSPLPSVASCIWAPQTVAVTKPKLCAEQEPEFKEPAFKGEELEGADLASFEVRTAAAATQAAVQPQDNFLSRLVMLNYAMQLKQNFTIETSVNAGGAIQPTAALVPPGGVANFTLSVFSGYEIASISGCPGSLVGLTFITAAIDAACHLSVQFRQIAAKDIWVTSRTSQGGKLQPDRYLTPSSSQVQFSVVPEQGYRLESITGCQGQLRDNVYLVNASRADCEVVARFTSADFAVFDAAIENYMAQHQLPQGVVAVVKDERLVYLKHYGTDANLHLVEQSYRLASVSKPLTLATILHLAEQGQLRLADRPFAPGGVLYQDLAALPYIEMAENITIGHLLGHLSGWNNQPFDPAFADPNQSLAMLFQQMLQQRNLVAVPGAQYNYLNFGYMVLSRIVEKTTGLTVANYLQSQMFAGITPFRLFLAGSLAAEKQPDEVSYSSGFGEMPYQMNIPRMAGAGGLAANARTLAAILIRIDGQAAVADVLSASSRNQSYLAGWWYHFGSLPGTSTFLAKMSSGYGIVALFNARNPNYETQNQQFFQLMDQIHTQVNWPAIDLLQSPP